MLFGREYIYIYIYIYIYETSYLVAIVAFPYLSPSMRYFASPNLHDNDVDLLNGLRSNVNTLLKFIISVFTSEIFTVQMSVTLTSCHVIIECIDIECKYADWKRK